MGASPDPITQEVNSAYVEPSPEADAEERAAVAEVRPADTTRDLLVYGGLAIALLSFGLLALAVTARRYFADPLLR